MIASLMMYDRPEIASATANYWTALRQALARQGVAAPEHLSNETDPFDVWQAPDLVLSQTCGLPYRACLADQVTLVGTPDYALKGCPPGYYTSVVVVRQDDPRTALADFAEARLAYNQTLSQSGFAAPYAMAQTQGFWFTRRLASGAHRASARMVAENAADLAAIDAQTWRLVCQFDDFASTLRVLCETPPTPGLPYITAKRVDPERVFNAVEEAIEALAPQTRAALHLRGIVRIPKSAYLALGVPPQGASA